VGEISSEFGRAYLPFFCLPANVNTHLDGVQERRAPELVKHQGKLKRENVKNITSFVSSATVSCMAPSSYFLPHSTHDQRHSSSPSSSLSRPFSSRGGLCGQLAGHFVGGRTAGAPQPSTQTAAERKVPCSEGSAHLRTRRVHFEAVFTSPGAVAIEEPDLLDSPRSLGVSRQQRLVLDRQLLAL